VAEKNLDLLDSHGVLNDMTDKAPKILDSERFNFLGTVRKETREIFKARKLTSKNEFRAFVLRNNSQQGVENVSKWSSAIKSHGVFSSPIISVVASIPEMYAHLPLPKDKNDHRVIDLYPVFTVSISDLPEATGLDFGDIIKVNFEDISNRTKPTITGIFKGGKDITRAGSLFGTCPPAKNQEMNTKPGRTAESQTQPTQGVNPCVTNNQNIRSPEDNHLGPVDAPEEPVSCGPELFKNIYGTDQDDANAEDRDEAQEIIRAAEGFWPDTRPGLHSVWQSGKKKGKVLMMAIPEHYAIKSGILIPEEFWRALKPMLDDMSADFWLPRRDREGTAMFVAQGIKRPALAYKNPNIEFDYSRMHGTAAAGLGSVKALGVPYAVPGVFEKENRKKGKSGLINSAFRTYPQQVYSRLYNAVINGKTRKDFKPGGGSPQEFSRWARSQGRINGFNSLVEFLTKAPNRSSNFNPSTATPGFSTHQIGSAVDFIGFNITKGTDEQGKQLYRWMARHAIHYGWMRTVNSEEWHWEYILDTRNARFAKWQQRYKTEPGYEGPPVSFTADTTTPEFMEWAKEAVYKKAGKSSSSRWHPRVIGPIVIGTKRKPSDPRLTLVVPFYSTSGMRNMPGTLANEIYQEVNKADQEAYTAATQRLRDLGVRTPTNQVIKEERDFQTHSKFINRNSGDTRKFYIEDLNGDGVAERAGRGRTQREAQEIIEQRRRDLEALRQERREAAAAAERRRENQRTRLGGAGIRN
jgi:hypothetical protein